MKKSFAASLILFLSICTLRAADTVLLGSAEMPSMNSFLNSAAPFMEKLSPGSSAKIILGSTALAFAPDLKDFDITQPVAIYIYACQLNQKNVEPVSAILLTKKSPTVPAQMKMTGQMLFTKTFDTKVMLSESKELLDSITRLPESLNPQDDQIKASFRPAQYAENYPQDFQNIRKGLVKIIASSGKRRLDVNGIKILNLKLAYLEKAIQQIDTISLSITPEKELIKLELDFKAKDKSAFSEFIAAQKKASAPSPAPAISKLISAAGHIEPTADLRKTLSEMTEGIAVEEADDESAMKYVSTLQLLFQTFKGSFSFYMDELPSQDNKRFTITSLSMQDPKSAQAILNSLSETSKKIDENIYSMTSVFIGPRTESKFICAVEGSDVRILSGPLSDKEAVEQFTLFRKNPPAAATSGSCNALLGKKDPSKARIEFKESTVTISVDLTPETLRPALPNNPLFNPAPAPQQPGQKKNKKKRIQLSPSDFMNK